MSPTPASRASRCTPRSDARSSCATPCGARPNGCIAAPSEGTVLRADALKVAYFQQTRDALDPTRTLSDTVCPDGDFVSYRGARVHVRGYLERFLFTTEQMNTPVGKLSGGEQSRVLL